MELEKARSIVADYKKLPADEWDEAVALCIADDEAVDEAVDEAPTEDE